MHCNVVSFTIGTNQFIAQDKNVETVVSIDQLFEMNSGPSWLPGIISHNGRPMLAVDTGQLLGITTEDYNYILIAMLDDERIALLITKFEGHLYFEDTLIQKLDGPGVLGDLVRAKIKYKGANHYCFNIHAFFDNELITGPHK